MMGSPAKVDELVEASRKGQENIYTALEEVHSLLETLRQVRMWTFAHANAFPRRLPSGTSDRSST